MSDSNPQQQQNEEEEERLLVAHDQHAIEVDPSPYDEISSDQSHSSNAASSPGSALPVAMPATIAPSHPLALTLIRTGENPLQVQASPDWTLSRLRSCAFPDSVLSSTSNVVVMIYMGRRFNFAAMERTLDQLGIMDGTSVHMLLQPAKSSEMAKLQPKSDSSASSSSVSSYQQSDMLEEGQLTSDLRYDDFGRLEGSSLLERQGTLGEFAIGVGMGCLLGLLSIIWILQPSLSRACRYGIFVGIALNFFLGLSHNFLLSPSMTPSHHGIGGPNGVSEPRVTGWSEEAAANHRNMLIQPRPPPPPPPPQP